MPIQTKKIEQIIEQIKKLEEELEEEIKDHEKKIFYRIEQGKAIFEEKIIREGKSKIISSIQYLLSFPLLAIITIPVIWSMMIPAVITDIFVSIYQYVCFPIYKIPLVKRKEYVVMDRYNLFYLDRVEKINCWYCEYFNGVISYVREIAARTEQYWCPIKHATRLKEPHSRYENFFSYGDYETYRQELRKRRGNFEDILESLKKEQGE